MCGEFPRLVMLSVSLKWHTAFLTGPLPYHLRMFLQVPFAICSFNVIKVSDVVI
jgi:hypothetical protein